MKKKLLVLLVLCNTILFADVSLNKYGHIERSEPQSSAEYFMENEEYYIDIEEKTLIGNSLFEIENGYLTLITIEENIPTWLRIYNKNGNLLLTKEFRKVINLSISENGKFAIFFDGGNVQVLNNSTLQLNAFPRSVIFDVNNFGEPILVDDNGNIVFKDRSYSLNANIRKVIFHNEFPLVITKNSIFRIRENLEKLYTSENEIFEIRIIENILYIVIKNNSTYKLLKFPDQKNIEKIDEIRFNKASHRTHEPIYSPLNYGAPNYPFPVGNSYGEIQQYGTLLYLHPGVDFLGDDFQEVYAVHDGFVKAVLTTGGDPYWRIAIANEDVSTETEGYLYAHLNQASITVNVGDEVYAGDLLGTLYPWGWYDFTHIHFARLQDEGAQWYGNWWTIDNPHIDVTNIQDTIPPTFENVIDNDLFAFRTNSGTYLDPNDLSGEFDIIAKCHDIENSDWRIDIWDIGFSLHPANDPDSTIYEQFSFAFDMPIDTYFSNYWTDIVLYTIYSRDATCYSIGNYDVREYYHIITNSNGDSLITEDDADEIFDSAQFPDGNYYFKVTARDASMNATADSMLVMFYNGNSADDGVLENNFLLQNYPNPFNPSTTISFSVPQTSLFVTLEIYNLKGQKVKTLDILECINCFDAKAMESLSHYSITWDGTDKNNQPVSTGIYFSNLQIDGKNVASKKMILLK